MQQQGADGAAAVSCVAWQIETCSGASPRWRRACLPAASQARASQAGRGGEGAGGEKQGMWERRHRKARDRSYYFNPVTGEKLWKHPGAGIQVKDLRNTLAD